MRQVYIRNTLERIQRRIQARFIWTVSSTTAHICARCLIRASVLVQDAEFICFREKLFLIGSAASGLTVRLPNMDQMTGGGLK